MWKSLIRCSIAGGIVVFLWSMLSWMVLPMHRMMMNQFTEPSQVSSTITRYAPKDGIYVIPGMEAREQGSKQTSIFVNVRRDVDSGSMIRQMVIGLISQMIGAFLITYMLLHCKMMRYWNRVGFVTIAGVLVAILGILPAGIWWHFPLGPVSLEVLDMVSSWFIGGLVIAKLVKN